MSMDSQDEKWEYIGQMTWRLRTKLGWLVKTTYHNGGTHLLHIADFSGEWEIGDSVEEEVPAESPDPVPLKKSESDDNPKIEKDDN